jgi:hypothetical protein
MESPTFTDEDLEVVPLPEREAMGLIKVNNNLRQSGGGRGGNNVLSDLIDAIVKIG